MIGKILALLSFIVYVHGIAIVKAPGPPEPGQVALMARYIMHEADWVSIATVSTLPAIKRFPFANLKSMSDGPVSNSTGVPYIFMTNMDLTGADLLQNNRCTIMASLAETSYCERLNLDPQDPRCARTILTGRLISVDNKTEEYQFSKNALFSRHPSMQNWPLDHGFYVAKLYIQQIIVLDYFGGIKYVTIEDYFKADINDIDNENKLFDNLKFK